MRSPDDGVSANHTGATKDVAGFVGMLRENQTYQFPKAFLDYRKNKSEAQ